MSHPTVYLISGANRGIGLALTETLAQRDNVRVFAGTRNPDSSAALQSVAKKYPGKVDIVNLVSADKANNEAAIKTIEKEAGRLDVVIANAGIGSAAEAAAEVKPEHLLECFKVNALGPLLLFQSAWPLLKQSTSNPKFVPVSSGAGSIALGAGMPFKTISYGTSKAAVNYITRKIYSENESLIAFPICPGPTETDMFNKGISDKNTGMKGQAGNFFKPKPVAEAATELLNVIDSATRESINNIFPTIRNGAEDGKNPW